MYPVLDCVPPVAVTVAALGVGERNDRLRVAADTDDVIVDVPTEVDGDRVVELRPRLPLSVADAVSSFEKERVKVGLGVSDSDAVSSGDGEMVGVPKDSESVALAVPSSEKEAVRVAAATETNSRTRSAKTFHGRGISHTHTKLTPTSDTP